MKKSLFLFLLLASQPAGAMSWLCCCTSKKKAREQWKKNFTLDDLQAIGITCTAEQYDQLSYRQQLFLGGLKGAFVAEKNYGKLLANGVQNAPDYPEPFKTQLAKFCAQEITKRELIEVVIVHESNS